MPYVVQTVAGPGWVRGRPMREQALWDEHAAFMNALVDERFVVLGGPLQGLPGGVHGALLIVAADSEAEARTRLAADPWSQHGLLQIAAIHPWEVLLGDLPRFGDDELAIFGRFHARPGQEDSVGEAVREVVAATRAEPGCLSIAAHRSPRDPRLFWIHARWNDEAAFEAHAGQPHTVRFLDRMRPLVDHELDISRAQRLA